MLVGSVQEHVFSTTRLGNWVQASSFPVEFGQVVLVAPGFLAVVAIAAVFLRSASVRLRRGNQARYISIATKNQPFSQGGWRSVANSVVGRYRKYGCLFLSIGPVRSLILEGIYPDRLARSPRRFHYYRNQSIDTHFSQSAR